MSDEMNELSCSSEEGLVRVMMKAIEVIINPYPANVENRVSS